MLPARVCLQGLRSSKEASILEQSEWVSEGWVPGQEVSGITAAIASTPCGPVQGLRISNRVQMESKLHFLSKVIDIDRVFLLF